MPIQIRNAWESEIENFIAMNEWTVDFIAAGELSKIVTKLSSSGVET